MKQTIFAVLLAAAAAACRHDPELVTSHRPEHGPTLDVQAEQVPAYVPVNGTVHAVRRASLSTRMMARVVSLHVDVGDRVAAGQVLVRLGVEDIAANRAKAEAAVTAARAAHAEAQRHAARMDTLYQQDAVARVQRDQARLHETQAAAQVTMAEAALAEVETADRYAAIRAPFAGAVVSRTINVGDLAVPGMPLLGIEGVGAREAVVNVPVDVATELEEATPVEVRTADGRHGEGTIRAIAAGADPMTRTVEVRAAVPAEWPTGVAVTALLPTGARETIAIPASAVVRRGQLTGVRVLTSNGPVLRWVRLGRTLSKAQGVEAGEDRVEVLSGLQPGERILL